MQAFYIKTLGCRLNQAESAMMKEELILSGMRQAEHPGQADFVLVNSCTVTARADSKTLAYARRARRENPAATIAIIGCMAQTAMEDLLALPYVDMVFGNQEKNALVTTLLRQVPHSVGVLSEHSAPLKLIAQASGDERVNLKIQDGCDNTCSYCLVTIARGPSRSIEMEHVLETAAELAHTFDEIILTGVHIGSYGKDLAEPSSLGRLMERLLEIPHLGRLRLSSIEPAEIDETILGLLNHPKLCRHLHISLQSADDRILALMNRHYRWSEALKVMEQVKSIDPFLKIGTDIIAGFPGESPATFESICQRIESSPLDYLHIFPFSGRPGTQAVDLPDQCPDHEKHARVQRLQAVAAHLQERFHRSCLGQQRWVLLEKGAGYLKGETDNYISVRLRENPTGRSKQLVRLSGLADDGQSMEGEIVTGS